MPLGTILSLWCLIPTNGHDRLENLNPSEKYKELTTFYHPLNLDPRLIWRELPFIVKIDSLFLLLIAIYSLYRLVHTLVITHRLRSPAAPATSGRSIDLALIRATEGHLTSLSSLNLFAFYLFGLLFFVFQMPYAFTTFGDGTETGSSIILRQLCVQFTYAADVFLMLLMLHSLRWIVSSWFYRVRDTSIIHL